MTLRLVVEAMEARVLLSTYGVSDVGFFNSNSTGANPESALVMDSKGNLYGTASAGGTNDAGTVFEIASGSNVMTGIASFNGANGSMPVAGVTLDSAGDLFGTTYSGGANNDGTVFEIAHGSNTITTLATFSGANGENPTSGITLDAAGNLYGTTERGGSSGGGIVFEISKGSSALTTLATFSTTGTSGYYPYGGVTFDTSGNLWGTTQSGGTSQYGAVFEVAAGTGIVTTAALFNGTNGETPMAGVTFDLAGDLFGTASAGGASSDGTVFEIAAGSTAITALASFNGTNGANPASSITLDGSGNLFGTTEYGGSAGGKVFEIAKGSSFLATVVSLGSGAVPMAGVTFDSAGDLYGTMKYGGPPGNYGSAFEIAKGSNQLSIIPCAPTAGIETQGDLVLDTAGNLYGTTESGGPYNAGTIFEIPSGSTTITTLATFGPIGGANPIGGMTIDSTGNLYGTTAYGGTGTIDDGTVFELPKGSNTITTLASFSGTNGANPRGDVTLDSSGNLYGTTYAGGAGDGTLFEVAKGTTAITTLASFNGTNGQSPLGRLAIDSSGNLFGATVKGGASNYGAVFELPQGASAISTIASFNQVNGQFPYGGVTLDSAGNLYGTTSAANGSGYGEVFEIAKGTNAITSVATFNLSTGWQPYGGVSFDSSGDLFGTTYQGGANDDGTVFEIGHGSSSITTLVSFSGLDGNGPQAGLVEDASGNLYGTTYYGGARGNGVVFKMSIAPTVSLTLSSGPNPSNATQSLVFNAAVSGGVPNGEMISLEDTNSNNKVLATGAISSGTATLTVPAGTLLAGTHNLIAVYGGDANLAPSQSVPYAQTVQVTVMKAQINGNLSSLVGVQRSMVDSILYTFSELVNISGTAATLAIHSGQSGTLPTSLIWTPINPSGDGSSTQWVVSFSGAGVVGNSIANGVYDITLNSSAVTSDANPAVNLQARPTDTFYRLFGDINGDGVVNAADNFQLKSAMATYNAAFDYNADGVVNAADNFQFKASQSYNFASSGIVYTI